MPVTLTAVLLSSADPRPAQVTLSGVAAGSRFEVVGTTADGSRWTIPGGSGVSDGGQLVLVDSRTALNSLITYQAVIDGATYAAAPLTVAYDGPGVGVVQTIDGLRKVGVEVVSVTEARTAVIRASTFEIAGREDPAARLDVPGSFAYAWEFDTQGADSAAMEAILRTGRPIVRRLPPGLRDFKPVVLGLVTSWSDELVSDGFGTWRRWSLKVREISDPQPSAALVAYVWTAFDDAMADRVWSYHSLFPSLAGWAAVNGALSLVTSGGYLTANYARAAATNAGAAVDIVESAYSAAAKTLGEAVTPGGTYTVSMRVKGAAGRSASALLKWSSGAVVTGAPVVLSGQWQQVSVTAVAPAGVTGLAAGARMVASGVAAGDRLEVSAPTVSVGSVVPVGSFDELFDTWDQFDAADWSLL
ncbi:hypothetical protein [uncultured Microbacterium sp.]|uniref:hypothetical protein n=1 Tax=uncultured Microbacterium sp. TaxID=191216 RepID=UPI0025CFE79C|nr:hypothetical protein [uncultured Microbacterium sp.]